MNWKQHLKKHKREYGLVLCFFVLLFGFNALNPDNNPNMTPDLAFTAISLW
jgi:K+-transporting ATPase ATPase A chain